VDLRYEGHDHTLTVPVTTAAEPHGARFLPAVAARFAEAHTSRYGHATPRGTG
jgi:N-methylhydantoinase A